MLELTLLKTVIISVVLDTPVSNFFKKSHAWPNRFLLRDGSDWFRIIDLQILTSINEISVYLKPPIDGLFSSHEPSGKISLPPKGFKDISISNKTPSDVFNGNVFFNPYLSWHSSGIIHANAYKTKDISKSIFLSDSEAISTKDRLDSPHIIMTAVLPICTLSYFRTQAPPSNFSGNYFEVSDKPYLETDLKKDGPVSIVLDRNGLKMRAIVMDIMVHDQSVAIDLDRKHPYPDGAEMYFVNQPITISPNNKSLPAVSIFFYQPIKSDDLIIEKKPIIFWGRSKNQFQDIFFQVMKI